MKKYDYSIVIPVFQNEGTLNDLYEQIKKAIIFQNIKLNGEIIFVDDNSLDKTYEVVKLLSKKYKNIRCIRRIRRRGLSSAVIEGCLSSSADLLVIMDADLQHDESKILEMIKIQKKYNLDMVVGSRFLEKKFSTAPKKS